MFAKKPRSAQSHIGSLIGAGTRIVGNVSFAGGLRVDGEINGNVSAAGERGGTLVVGEHARIEGKLTAPRLLVNGTVVGPTISTEFVELLSRAKVTGNVYYSGITMRPGAAIIGQLVHCVSDSQSGDLELVYAHAGPPR